MIPVISKKMDPSVNEGYLKNKYAERKLMCMLQNSKGCISVPVLCKEYCGIFGHEIPYKELGYVSVEEYLKSVSEVSCVWCEKSKCYFASYKSECPAVRYQHEQKTGFESSCRGGRSSRDVGPTRKKFSLLNKYKKLDKIRSYLVNLVKSHQDGLTIPELSVLYEEQTREKLNLYDHGFNTLYDFVDTVDELLIVTKSGIDRVFWTKVPCSSNRHYSVVGMSKKQSTVHSEENVECRDSMIDSSNCFNGVMSSSILDKFCVESSKFSLTESRINDTVKNYFRRILKNHPEGVWASQFCQKYQELVGCHFDMQSIGYYNFITLIEDLPSIFAWKENQFSSGDFLLFDAENFEGSEGNLLQGDDFDKLSPEKKLQDVISKIRSLLSFHEEGIYVDEFFHVYKLNFGRVFNLEELGWQSLKVFLDSIAEEVPLCTISSTKRTKVYSCHSRSDSFGGCIKFPVPSDAVDADAKFKPQWIPVGVHMEDFTYIYTASISNPSHLYIQFDDGNTFGVLDQLMEDIQEFYDSDDGALYKMNDIHVKKGTICAGIYHLDRNWHRVEIKEVFCDDVQAYFVDYGSLEKVNKKDLRYLRKKFFDLPSQAVVARLANIKPLGVRWDACATDVLLEKCSDKRLKACIFGRKRAERILYLYVWDTSHGSQSASINDILVHGGYANYCDHSLDADMCINPNWSILKYQSGPAAETNIGISSTETSDLPASLGNLKIDATPRYGGKTAVLSADGVTSSAASVYDHQNDNLSSYISQVLRSATEFPQNETTLQLLLNALSQNSPNKSPTDVDFSSQLYLLVIIQNLLTRLNTSPNVDEMPQRSDLLYSLLNIVNKNKDTDSPCFVNSLNHPGMMSLLANKPPHSETKTTHQSMLQNVTSFVNGLNSLPGQQPLLMAAEQVCQANVNKPCRSTLPPTALSNFCSLGEIDGMSDFIPPPQPARQLHCDDEVRLNISPPIHAASIARHSNGHSTSPFSSLSLSHSLNSSWSSDEKNVSLKSPSSSTYDLESYGKSVSPSSCETVPVSFKFAAERNEPDVYNEISECPLENLCKEVMTKSNRSVKRLFLRNHVILHIIKLMGRPHISCHDIAWITVGCGSISQLVKKASEKNISRCPVRIYKTNDEELFEEIERYGIRKITHKIVNSERIPVLSVFPLRVAVEYVYALAQCPEEIVESIQFQVTQPDLDDDYESSPPWFEQNYSRHHV